MVKKTSQEFKLKSIDKTRNYLIEETNRNKLIRKKHKKVCTTIIYIEDFLILGSTVTACSSISIFASLVGIPVRVTSFAIGLEDCTITAAFKKLKSIIKKKKKKHNKMVSLANFKLNSIES